MQGFRMTQDILMTKRTLLIFAILACTLPLLAQPMAPPPDVQGDWLGSLTLDRKSVV